MLILDRHVVSDHALINAGTSGFSHVGLDIFAEKTEYFRSSSASLKAERCSSCELKAIGQFEQRRRHVPILCVNPMQPRNCDQHRLLSFRVITDLNFASICRHAGHHHPVFGGQQKLRVSVSRAPLQSAYDCASQLNAHPVLDDRSNWPFVRMPDASSRD